MERKREPMDKNRIQGDAEQGEQTKDCTKLLWLRRGDVNPVGVRGRIAFLPGENSPDA